MVVSMVVVMVLVIMVASARLGEQRTPPPVEKTEKQRGAL